MKILKFGNVTMRGDDLHVSGFTFDCEWESYNYNERNIAAMEAIIAFLAAELSLMPPSIDYANMEACCFKTDAVDAIAPPVAAGSVDASPSFWDHIRWIMAGLHKGHGAEDVAIGNMHTWHIAWGAQQREAGKAEQTAFLKECMDRGQAEFNRKWTEQKERAEKAEDDLKARDFFVDVLNCQVKKAQGEADVLFHRLNAANGHLSMARERIDELEAEIKVLHQG